ncbi:MAG: NAD-dependent epimerase/dehydratase family protein [Planctomycetota bacterium]
MDALVTGATGFLGYNIAASLARDGQKVRGMCRESSDPERIKKLEAYGVEIAWGDITDAEAVDRAVAGCEKVYHIAACFRTSGHLDGYYRAVNRDGVAHVLASCRKHGAERLIHCSTGGVHGHIPPERAPAGEDAPITPGDIYQVTKWEGEQLVHEAIEQGQPATVFRPAGIYGAGDMRLVKLFSTVQKGRFVMFGDGEPHFGMVYIDDLVAGVRLMADKDEALGEVFILSGPDELKLNDLVHYVADATNGKEPKVHWPVTPLLAAAYVVEKVCVPFGIHPPIHRRRAHVFINNREFTNAKAKRVLGYDPQITGREGVYRTAEWYFEHGILKGEFPGYPEGLHRGVEL